MKNEKCETTYENYFDDNDKKDAFDQIAALFYDKNFGSASKSDVELLMFHLYMEAIIRKNRIKNTHVISYSACSDYKISRQLGITQQRVRNLKVKKELVYPQKDFDWKESFASILSDEKNVHFDEKNVRINIPDPNLFDAIQDFVEDNGGYIEWHWNRKILEMQKIYLVQIALFLEKGENKTKIEKYLYNHFSKEKIINICSFVPAVLKAKNADGIVNKVIELLSDGNVLKCAVKKFYEMKDKMK
ncbi:MAG: hypothetical protein MR466_05885 [Ruminococcus sp.]|nr:hypothetical protein [Ruminococcus sp.]MCI7258932.1 hypothetical protein [Ruminococcus sp.]MCI7629405.1 hypothetical protein [Ruminococcus sp.]MDD6946106.1 hypothetical protein [Ruminococcus sp.]MDY6145538.1 hypothetical protein [Ruminococcus callidus]